MSTGDRFDAVAKIQSTVVFSHTTVRMEVKPQMEVTLYLKIHVEKSKGVPLRTYMVIARYPLPQNDCNLHLPSFVGNYPIFL